jgi:hypothetical protein
MWAIVTRGLIAAVIVASVTEVSKRFPRTGALLLTLPLVSILAFIMSWNKDRDLTAIARLAREMLVLVPLSLPFFVPLALCDKLGLSFWKALVLGIGMAGVTVGLRLALGTK